MFEQINESLKHKPSLYGNYGTRNSFISNYKSDVKTIKLGVTFNKQFTLAIGYNWLDTKFESKINKIDTELRLRYISPFMEYSFLEKNDIEVTIPVYLGFGTSFYESKTKQKLNQQFIVLYEPSMTVTYRLLRYIGLSAGVGYRLLLVGNKKINQNLNAPTYSLGVNLFFGTIYRDIKPYLFK